MRTTAWLLLLFLVIAPSNCEQCSEDCDDTTAPEINFGLVLGGHILCVIEQLGDEIDVTQSYFYSDFIMSYSKIYCDGTPRGPFTTNFKIGETGLLENQGIGYMSFRMDNTKDYINFTFEIQYQEDTYKIKNANYKVYYDMFKPYDGNNAHIDFNIKIKWDEGNPTAESIVATIF
ncbi:MAG: hypothetical protein JXB19_10950 [Bacteroidales bacterium]|nr:hypothetical protein [Bacteroidales bacterium]